MRHVILLTHKGVSPVDIDPGKEAKKYRNLNLGGTGNALVVVDFPTIEKNGWELGYNETSNRFDLLHNGTLVVSDQNPDICISRAEFDVFGVRRTDGVMLFENAEV